MRYDDPGNYVIGYFGYYLGLSLETVRGLSNAYAWITNGFKLDDQHDLELIEKGYRRAEDRN